MSQQLVSGAPTLFHYFTHVLDNLQFLLRESNISFFGTEANINYMVYLSNSTITNT